MLSCASELLGFMIRCLAEQVERTSCFIETCLVPRLQGSKGFVMCATREKEKTAHRTFSGTTGLVVNTNVDQYR